MVVNGFSQQGPAAQDTPVRIKASTFWDTSNDVVSLAASFAGLDTGANHLQAGDGVTADVTDKVMVPALAGYKIVVFDVSVTTGGGTENYVGTLAQSDKTSDIIQFTIGPYGQYRSTTMFQLEENKGLTLYRASGNVGSTSLDANTVTVYYSYVQAS